MSGRPIKRTLRDTRVADALFLGELRALHRIPSLD